MGVLKFLCSCSPHTYKFVYQNYSISSKELLIYIIVFLSITLNIMINIIINLHGKHNS